MEKAKSMAVAKHLCHGRIFKKKYVRSNEPRTIYEAVLAGRHTLRIRDMHAAERTHCVYASCRQHKHSQIKCV